MEDNPFDRLTNACLLTQVRDDLRFLRVDAERGAIEMANELGQWRSFSTLKPGLVAQVADRLRLMGCILDRAEPDPCTGRLTVVTRSESHRFEVFSFRESRNLVVVRYLSEWLLERTWPWPDPPAPEPDALRDARAQLEAGDPSGAMATLRDFAESAMGPARLLALALMAAAATQLGHLRVRRLIDEERLAHAREVPGASYDVIEGLLFAADVSREDGEYERAEARVLEAIPLAREVQRGLPLHLGALELLEEVRRARGDAAGADDAGRELDAASEQLTGCPADPGADTIRSAIAGVPPED